MTATNDDATNVFATWVRGDGCAVCVKYGQSDAMELMRVTGSCPTIDRAVFDSANTHGERNINFARKARVCPTTTLRPYVQNNNNARFVASSRVSCNFRVAFRIAARLKYFCTAASFCVFRNRADRIRTRRRSACARAREARGISAEKYDFSKCSDDTRARVLRACFDSLINFTLS